VKGAEFEISEALGYHPIAFLESHLAGEISGFFSRLYFIQVAGKIEAFLCLQKNIPSLSEYWSPARPSPDSCPILQPMA
jgi:hypothetical protein